MPMDKGKSLVPAKRKGGVLAKIPPRIPTPETLALAVEIRKLGAPEPMRQFLASLPSRAIDLSAAPLQGLLMSDLNLGGATMIGVAFNGSDLTGSDLRAVFAPRLGGQGGRFRGVNFTGADLRESIFTNADLTGANFTLCNLANSILTGANVDLVKFVGCDLTGAYLVGLQNWETAIFEYARLTGAIFSPGLEEIILERTMPTTSE